MLNPLKPFQIQWVLDNTKWLTTYDKPSKLPAFGARYTAQLVVLVYFPKIYT